MVKKKGYFYLDNYELYCYCDDGFSTIWADNW